MAFLKKNSINVQVLLHLQLITGFSSWKNECVTTNAIEHFSYLAVPTERMI